MTEVGMNVGSCFDLEILLRENFGPPIGVDQIICMDHFFADPYVSRELILMIDAKCLVVCWKPKGPKPQQDMRNSFPGSMTSHPHTHQFRTGSDVTISGRISSGQEFTRANRQTAD
jgi:hypothetical protein